MDDKTLPLVYAGSLLPQSFSFSGGMDATSYLKRCNQNCLFQAPKVSVFIHVQGGIMTD